MSNNPVMHEEFFQLVISTYWCIVYTVEKLELTCYFRTDTIHKITYEIQSLSAKFIPNAYIPFQ